MARLGSLLRFSQGIGWLSAVWENPLPVSPSLLAEFSSLCLQDWNTCFIAGCQRRTSPSSLYSFSSVSFYLLVSNSLLNPQISLNLSDFLIFRWRILSFSLGPPYFKVNSAIEYNKSWEGYLMILQRFGIRHLWTPFKKLCLLHKGITRKTVRN